jgi:hypothetical protein
MLRPTPLDKQWDELMLLCSKEAEFQRTRSHPKVTHLVSVAIDRLARDMGFDEGRLWSANSEPNAPPGTLSGF